MLKKGVEDRCVVINLDSLWTALHTIHSGRSRPTLAGGTHRLYRNIRSIFPERVDLSDEGEAPLSLRDPGAVRPRVIHLVPGWGCASSKVQG